MNRDYEKIILSLLLAATGTAITAQFVSLYDRLYPPAQLEETAYNSSLERIADND